MAEEMVPIFRVADAPERAKWYLRWGFEIVGGPRFAAGMALYLFLAQPWAREIKLTDPDGNRLRVATGHE